MRCERDVFAVAFVFMTSDNKSLSLQNRREGKKFRFISKITNFLFHSCGERHFLWFSCFLAVLWWCAASAAACCASLNIIIFISSANYFVFPLWKAHERQTKLCCFTLPPSLPQRPSIGSSFFGNDNIKRRDLSTRKKNFKHWYKFLWWFTDRNHVMWVEIKENIDFFFALHRHTALVVVVVDDRRECEVF